MDHDTSIGGPANRFPDTNLSAIVGARSPDVEVRQRAIATIVQSYWKPCYKYIRIKWQAANEDAKDLTQGFFASAIEKRYFDTYDAKVASFQTFIRICLDRYIANQRKSEQRLKRGGGSVHLSLDFSEAERELLLRHAISDISPEDFFRQEWIRSLFSLAIDDLRQHYVNKGAEVYFQLFEIHDLVSDENEHGQVKPSYAMLANRFQLSTTDVTNYLAATRRQFRKCVLARLRQLTATDEEYRTEARALLGVEVA